MNGKAVERAVRKFDAAEKRKRSQKWGDCGDRYERDILQKLRSKNWTK
jgi:hypothetical protein